MTTQELKQYIDKVLGNGIRCLLPSYWWKRLFSLTLDKVDEKLDAANIKTINGESVIGEGNLKVGITSVSSMEELNILEVEAGDVATVASREYGKINPYACYRLTSEPTNKNVIIENWDKFKRITHIDAVQPEESIGKAATILLHAYAPWAQDVCQITYWFSEFKIYVGSGSSSVQYSLEELNNLLKESDYRLVSITEDAESREVFAKYVSLYSPDVIVSDAYVKSDSWDKLAKENIITSEEELKLWDAPIGTIAQVLGVDNSKIKEARIRDCYSTDLSKNPIKKLDVLQYSSSGAYDLAFKSLGGDMYVLVLSANDTFYIDKKYPNDVHIINHEGNYYQDEVDSLNEILKHDDYYFIGSEDVGNYTASQYDVIEEYVKAYTYDYVSIADAYIKSDTWTRLLKEGEGGSNITVDSELSDTSENPVQNKVVASALNDKVNKVYVDNAIANAITTTLNTAV